TKLVDRATRMVMEELGIEKNEAETLIQKYGNVRNAIDNYVAK
ncbi:MAG: N-acetylmuramic acid 6-phosphate etherase, partial [Thalassobius sp.]|nr:N-acetylmuramic acid 6-phosphate etherase [Thalassovita sp.]